MEAESMDSAGRSNKDKAHDDVRQRDRKIRQINEENIDSKMDSSQMIRRKQRRLEKKVANSCSL